MEATWPTGYQRELFELFAVLTPGETDAHVRYQDLARRTNEELKLQGCGPQESQYNPNSGGFGLPPSPNMTFSEALSGDWDAFAELFADLMQRHPRLELDEWMKEIGHRKEFISWPSGHEWDIEEWVAKGGPDRLHTWPIDNDIRDRLLVLHPLLGGWLYYDGPMRGVVFAETDRFRAVKVQADLERDAHRKVALEKAERFRQEREARGEGEPDLNVYRIIADGSVSPDEFAKFLAAGLAPFEPPSTPCDTEEKQG